MTVAGTGATPISHAPTTGTGGSDPRYDRPAHDDVGSCPGAGNGRPDHGAYLGLYGGWYVHPWYRWQYGTTLVVHTTWGQLAWSEGWTPASRAGWTWVPGSWIGGIWNPGYWQPLAPPPAGYVFTSGTWYGGVYVDGYYRVARRTDGDWTWVPRSVREGRLAVPGHWRPQRDGPDGYVWEPGFWDGQRYNDGFWRPRKRRDYRWVDARVDERGVLRSGYWEPRAARTGQVWVPGWFDGNSWQRGYWISESDWESEDVRGFKAPASEADAPAQDAEELPLGIPVE